MDSGYNYMLLPPCPMSVVHSRKKGVALKGNCARGTSGRADAFRGRRSGPGLPIIIYAPEIVKCKTIWPVLLANIILSAHRLIHFLAQRSLVSVPAVFL